MSDHLRRSLVLLLFGSLLITGCSRGRSDSILVFAAASLSEVLQAHGAAYSQLNGLPEGTIRFHFQSSTVCAAQIRQGAPADLFVSADDRLVVQMARAGWLDRSHREQLIRNRLALVIPVHHPSPIRSVSDLTGTGYRRFAMGDPESVPAGRYGRTALGAMGLWDAVSGRLLRAEHVRQALLYVATGEAEAGLVYVSDSTIEKGVRIAQVIPEESTPDILYGGAVVRGTRHMRAAAGFLAFLASAESAPIWERFGFTPLRGGRGRRGNPAG